MKKIILLNVLFLNLIFSQQTPAPTQDKSVLIFGGITHVGDGQIINNSVIGFTDGKIDLIASSEGNWTNEKLGVFSDSNNKKYDTIIDASNHHIYPGIIALNSNLGLVEVDAVRASVDDDESGTYLLRLGLLLRIMLNQKQLKACDLMVFLLHKLHQTVGLFQEVHQLFN
jgi:imidazolonepropionase-like amidohydrolase